MLLWKEIKYCDHRVLIVCDGKCNKAWGINNRPRIQLSDNDDDYAYYADSELGDAPVDPGTYEGDDAKPVSIDEFPNKWCARECERSTLEEIKDLSRRFYNASPHYRRRPIAAGKVNDEST